MMIMMKTKEKEVSEEHQEEKSSSYENPRNTNMNMAFIHVLMNDTFYCSLLAGGINAQQQQQRENEKRRKKDHPQLDFPFLHHR